MSFFDNQYGEDWRLTQCDKAREACGLPPYDKDRDGEDCDDFDCADICPYA